MKSVNLYKLFTICRILRELGYRKESELFMVKAKGKSPVILRLNLDNPWKRKHFDFNGYYSYDPRMGIPRNAYGDYTPALFEYYPSPGYICTFPKKVQIVSFIDRLGYHINDVDNIDNLLIELISIYRIHTNNHDAFKRYIKNTENESSN